MNSMKTVVACCFGLSIAAVARADAFPDADASHDFTSPAAWNATALPETAAFSGVAAEAYSAGADASFASFALQAGARTFDLSATAGRVISVTGAGDSGGILVSSGSTNEFRGGVWTFTGDGALNFAASAARDASVVLSGGCVVTNVRNVLVSQAPSAGNRLVVSEKSVLHCTGSDSRVGRWTADSSGENGSTLAVLSGGRFVATGMFWLCNGSASKPSRSAVGLHVSGEGSTFECLDATSGLYLGGPNLSGDFVTVEDGATLRLANYLCIGFNQGGGGFARDGRSCDA